MTLEMNSKGLRFVQWQQQLVLMRLLILNLCSISRFPFFQPRQVTLDKGRSEK